MTTTAPAPAAVTMCQAVTAKAKLLSTRTAPLILPAGLVCLWWATSRNSASIYYPPLSHVATVVRDDWWSSRLRDDLLPSLVDLFIALAIATCSAMLLGALIGASALLYRAVLPILDMLRACPGVALVPVALAVFGIGDTSEIAVIAFSGIWPILLNMVDGVRDSMGAYHDARRYLRLNARQTFRYISIPAALPQAMAGIYTSLSIGVVVMVASEYYSSSRGIGFYLSNAEHTFAIDATYAGVVVLGIVGYVLSGAFRIVERIVLRWQRAGE